MSIFSAKGLHAASQAAVEAAQTAAEQAQTAAETAKTFAEGILANESVTLAKVSATLLGPAAGAFGLRKLGTGSTEAAAGNDARLSDERTPSASSVVIGKIAAALLGPAANEFGLRKLGLGATEAKPGNSTTPRTFPVEYGIEGEVEKRKYIAFVVPKLQATESWKLVGVIFQQTKGTATVTVEKNGASVGAPFQNVATSGSVNEVTGSINIAEKDVILFNVTAVSGTEPEGLIAQLVFQTAA